MSLFRRLLSIKIKLVFVALLHAASAVAREPAFVPTESVGSSAPVTASGSSAPMTAHHEGLPSAAPTQTIVFIGDSLTQGYGVRKQEAFPDRVQELLRARGRFVTAINGGISGSRSADADRRLLWYLKLNPKPVMVVLALGSNDALSGTRVDVIQDHLAKAIRVAKAEHLKVLLCGVQVYTNFGQDYNKALAQMFQSLARAEKVELMPFLLEGVAMNKELNQADQKHPNARGHEIIAHHLADRIDKILFSKRQK